MKAGSGLFKKKKKTYVQTEKGEYEEIDIVSGGKNQKTQTPSRAPLGGIYENPIELKPAEEKPEEKKS